VLRLTALGVFGGFPKFKLDGESSLTINFALLELMTIDDDLAPAAAAAVTAEGSTGNVCDILLSKDVDGARLLDLLLPAADFEIRDLSTKCQIVKSSKIVTFAQKTLLQQLSAVERP